MKPIINFILKCMAIIIIAHVVLLSGLISFILWDKVYVYKVVDLVNYLVWGDKL